MEEKDTIIVTNAKEQNRSFSMNAIRHLNTVIRRMEDSLLTSKNPYEIEEIRRCLQKKKIGTSENGTKMERKELNQVRVLI